MKATEGPETVGLQVDMYMHFSKLPHDGLVPIQKAKAEIMHEARLDNRNTGRFKARVLHPKTLTTTPSK